MLHIHRHVNGLTRFRPAVIAQKREGDWAGTTPSVVKRSPFRFVARGLEHLTGRPWQIGAGEAKKMRAIASGCGLLHVFFGDSAVHLLPLIRSIEVPVVISFHGADVAGAIAGNGYRVAREEMFAEARLVMCRSEQLAAKVVRLGCDPKKIRIMKTVIPDTPFVERSAPADGAWRIVQACRLVPKKGLATSLRAFEIFRKRFPEATFTIAGEGAMENELRELASSLGIADAVTFAGFLPQDELGKLFVRSHIFLHPSETKGGDVEGIPNSLLEAMASGLPAVATRHGGIPEVIESGANGLLCDEKDPAGVADALFRLTDSPKLYSDIARSGSQTVREKFSAQRRIAEIEDLYIEACGA